MNDAAEGKRMTVEIISWSISTKVWDWAGIKLAAPGSAGYVCTKYIVLACNGQLTFYYQSISVLLIDSFIFFIFSLFELEFN